MSDAELLDLRPDTPVEALPGVTASRAEAFERLGVLCAEDLLRLAPRRHEDRRHPTAIAELEAGVKQLVVGTLVSSKVARARGGLSILEATVEDASGRLVARWFHRGYTPRAYTTGQRVALYGEPGLDGKRWTMRGPALERDPTPSGRDEGPGWMRLVPVHPLSKGLSAPFVRRLVWRVLPLCDALVDRVPVRWRETLDLPALRHTLRQLHFPESQTHADAARRRLAFDELLLHELLVLRRKARRAVRPGLRCPLDATLDARIRARFPFELTAGQDAALRAIVRDLSAGRPMHRLLQGDVGSGKTAVATYALLLVVARGLQGALMAPTEILARQHHDTLARWLAGSRVRIGLLAGGRRSKARTALLQQVAAGEIDLLVGTHAVLTADVAFARLGLVVVDEQHKFGVAQRETLIAKGGHEGRPPHVLIMTATPIPRTLALTVYGDLDVSVVEGRLPGRRGVETWVVRPSEGRRVLDRMKAALAAGEQAYVIYPLVEESEQLALRDAEDGHRRWTRALPDARVGLLHGRLKRAEKAAVMDAFQAGELDVLVSTVVVEVGVDVARATLLIVEHAERFGLSQLHQLRGRVGRGNRPGLCVLVDRSQGGRPPRLDVLVETQDGFRIAEEDLALRGIGDLFGTRQHGQPGFRAARLPRDLPLLERAREAAAGLLAEDPDLRREDHRPLGRALRAYDPGRG